MWAYALLVTVLMCAALTSPEPKTKPTDLRGSGSERPDDHANGGSRGLTRFWAVTIEELTHSLDTSEAGLTSSEAKRRLRTYGANRLQSASKTASLALLLRQFKSPLLLILLVAAGLSFFLNESIDAAIIIAIILLSAILGFWQEKRASDAVQTLLSVVRITTRVIRDGIEREVPAEDLVPGDICVFSAGNVIPCDARILQSRDLYVDESALTGESFPAEKQTKIISEDATQTQRTNSLFMGTHVISGTARALVVFTGSNTEFGRLSKNLRLSPPETEFERGLRQFSYVLTKVTLILAMVIFAITVYLQRPLIDSFLFVLAIAVGIIPELLPAIISINLAVGAVHMARRKVIVKQLASIENLGSMNVLCTDKTGTLTEGTVKLHQAIDADEKATEKGLFYAYLNSFYETGFTNPIDEAIRAQGHYDVNGYRKLDEVPYDFIRKRLSVLIAHDENVLMITKGAVSNILDVCSEAEISGTCRNIEPLRKSIEQHTKALGANGFRTLGLAYKHLPVGSRIKKSQESGLTFLALLVFSDPCKEGVVEAVNELRKLGIKLKVISGDNAHVAASVTRTVLGYEPEVLTGRELEQMNNEALRRRVNTTDVFAEIEPRQKERLIIALKKSGNTVGYLGDGINDALALHSADVGISVNSAVDVAKEAAVVVLLEKDLGVLAAGVREGRKTFANTLKYIYMTMSANFGNMFSMAGAALFLPFLPLLPKQILLNNFLTDFPAMAIPTDDVDQELIQKPRTWDVKIIRDFMITFGIISSLFDFLTFAVLFYVFRATTEQFRTGWFVESVMTEVLIIVVLRTWKPFYKSLPGRTLSIVMVAVLLITLALPYSPLSEPLGLVQLKPSWLLILMLITVAYAAATELPKKLFYRRVFEG
jgi:Mg2+-importing ATPase